MKQKQRNEVMETLALVMQVGICMIVPIMLCPLLGVWIGEKTGVRWSAVAGFVIGAVSGGESVYKIVKKYLKNK